jgi:transposase
LNSKNQQLTKHFPIFVLYENNLLSTVWNSNYTFLKRISWMTQEENQEDPWLHAARRWGPHVQAKAIYEMVANGRSCRELAARNPEFASFQTYARLYNHFQLYGEIPHQTKVRRQRNRNKTYKGILSISVQNILLQRATNCPTSYLHEFQEFLEVNGHGWYSVDTISRFLRSKGLSRAILLKSAIQQDAILQQQFLDEVSCIPSLDMFNMVDETHTDRKAW